LIYSNNPNDSSDGNPSTNPKPDKDHPTGVTPKDKTITFVAELDLTKYFDKVDAANYLAGATFTLTGTSNVPRGTTAGKYVADANGTFYKLKDNTFTTSVPHGDIKRSDGTVAVESNEAYYESTTQKYKLTSETAYEYVTKDVFMQGTSDANGKITFKGLGAGTYTLKETVTPSGYNTAEDITFTITVTVPETITTGTETATWESNNNSVTVDGTTAIYKTNVIDNSGSTLPSTGGMGTTLFYVIGGLLIVAAAIVIISKRRVQEG
jgi:LPXTG-motif cell wall-anchored protein